MLVGWWVGLRERIVVYALSPPAPERGVPLYPTIIAAAGAAAGAAVCWQLAGRLGHRKGIRAMNKRIQALGLEDVSRQDYDTK